ncbi:hypothetical protein Pelo_4610 [Pelomyxa schiedti]|nr:hypothetical protein Pelo_4610 [Pelomyxa schiedti]
MMTHQQQTQTAARCSSPRPPRSPPPPPPPVLLHGGGGSATRPTTIDCFVVGESSSDTYLLDLLHKYNSNKNENKTGGKMDGEEASSSSAAAAVALTDLTITSRIYMKSDGDCNCDCDCSCFSAGRGGDIDVVFHRKGSEEMRPECVQKEGSVRRGETLFCATQDYLVLNRGHRCVLQDRVTGQRVSLFDYRPLGSNWNSSNSKWLVVCDREKREMVVVEIPKKSAASLIKKPVVVPLDTACKGGRTWEDCRPICGEKNEDHVELLFTRERFLEYAIVDLRETFSSKKLVVLSKPVPPPKLLSQFDPFVEGGLLFQVRKGGKEILVTEESSGAHIVTFKLFKPFKWLLDCQSNQSSVYTSLSRTNADRSGDWFQGGINKWHPQQFDAGDPRWHTATLLLSMLPCPTSPARGRVEDDLETGYNKRNGEDKEHYMVETMKETASCDDSLHENTDVLLRRLSAQSSDCDVIGVGCCCSKHCAMRLIEQKEVRGEKNNRQMSMYIDPEELMAALGAAMNTPPPWEFCRNQEKLSQPRWTARHFEQELLPSMVSSWNDLLARQQRVGLGDVMQLAVEYGCVSGKWLLFADTARVNDTWGKLRQSIQSDPRSVLALAKVSTTPGQGGRSHVICVYTPDFTDEADVMAHRRQLHALGFHAKLTYKPDIYTHLGIYRKNRWGIPPHAYYA